MTEPTVPTESTSKADRITLARLDGTATRHVQARSPDAVAIAELIEIATDPKTRRLRVDLLSEAAGTMTGRHQADPVIAYTAERGAQLLVAAGGTDQTIGRAQADRVRRRLTGTRRLQG